MSPEVSLLVRAVLLGLLVLAIERFGRRRQARRAELRRMNLTVVRLPATQHLKEPPLVGRPLQVGIKEKRVKQGVVQGLAAAAKPAQTAVLRLEPRTAPAYVTEKHHFDGHVTEKRAA